MEPASVIPVRVPAGLAVHVAGDPFRLDPDHPLNQLCPVCDEPLGGELVGLVAVGVAPRDRRPSGRTTGSAVIVHAACTNQPEKSEATNA